jgi:hypothetical protein
MKTFVFTHHFISQNKQTNKQKDVLFLFFARMGQKKDERVSAIAF